ncbi:putative F420-dependent oxidoreductase [Kribbella orskensis]|uniref:F420-dependent oxidoreductase n=1 Tax=Kribbella orskensis TaxID=2512216 RepID=A0ABY2BGZ9_9ACTN|nr:MULTISPECIES: LLM class F420-dependent oxidoreductase [Kribbella]TCN38429.1 putative F420-dependent oxidoreductase [Kribbella sp. VKM Ac-2500]TCO20041.1 putative F420-dependent oxidoreductase [Kribbella orskensis]
MVVDLGRFGVWHQAHKWGPELAAGVEQAGYGAIWLGASPTADLRDAEVLLASTNSAVVGTSIVNMWKDDATAVAESYHRLESEHPGRFVLGVGIGHPERDREYKSPYETIVDYLDVLDEAKVPAGRRMLAALGPRVLKLSAARTAGALPYLTTPEHTRQARETLGSGVLLAPEQKVVLETDDEMARSVARDYLASYLQLSNYTSNLKRLGYSDHDIADGGSDDLVDALVLHGTAVEIAEGLNAHLEAGADQVVIQQLGKEGPDLLPGYEALATVLL